MTPPGRVAVLVVEDHAEMRRLMIRILEAAGMDVLGAADVDEAQTHLRARPDVAVLVADVHLGAVSGTVVAQRLSAINPNLRVLYTSGYGARFTRAAGVEGSPLLGKPFRPNELVAAVKKLLAV